MKFITDFHIHSHFSIATSGNLVPEKLDYWAKLKGIDVLGTGDCIHPGWSNELLGKIEPAGNGLFRLKKQFIIDEPGLRRGISGTDFILTGEVSSIYKKDGRVRKVHSILVFPDFESLKKVQQRLDKMGNIRSDGRPILGIDPVILFEMTLDSSPEAYLIPAHIWTPWFSVLGSKSGFDSLEECFGSLTGEIFAAETGLSSDPPMNRLCSFLDGIRLVSNSDAHSPEKLGREANLFECEKSYTGIRDALKYDRGFAGTIEFFPEEGKYHLDGHRKCGVRTGPEETARLKGLCPVCGKPLTLGVMNRVHELADRETPPADSRHPHRSATQLTDIIAEVMNRKGASSKLVTAEYRRLLSALGTEFDILLNTEIAEISAVGGPVLAEAIKRLREGRVILDAGYDGEFGSVRMFADNESRDFTAAGLFPAADLITETKNDSAAEKHGSTDAEKYSIPAATHQAVCAENESAGPAHFEGSAEQTEAVHYTGGHSIVIAGPGTGKTRVLTEKIRYLIETGVDPVEILAVTFSNRAAREIAARLEGIAPCPENIVHTFHSYGLDIIKRDPARFGRKAGVMILGADELASMNVFSSDKKSAPLKIKKIHEYKEGMLRDGNPPDGFEEYEEFLEKINALDIPDLIYKPVAEFSRDRNFLEEMTGSLKWIMADEAQDINGIQYELTRIIASAPGKKLFVIGDPDQSIYAFRGAVDVFRMLPEDFRGIKFFSLSRSFRCPDRILEVGAGALRSKKRLSGISSDVKVQILSAESGRSEADWIAGKIESLMGGLRSYSMYSGMSDGDAADAGVSFGGIGVLCRAAFMFDPLVKSFKEHAVPYRIIDNGSLFSREPYSRCVAVMKSAWYSIPLIKKYSGTLDVMEAMSSGQPAANIFRMLMMDVGATDDETAAAESHIYGFGSDYDSFFRSISLRTGADDLGLMSESVSLMTLHSSKGLEFKYIFIPGCEEGIIPFTLFGMDSRSIEEEERLFYVGVTRTIERLFLSSAKSRKFKGRILNLGRSSILGRFEEGLLEKVSRGARKKSGDSQLVMFE